MALSPCTRFAILGCGNNTARMYDIVSGAMCDASDLACRPWHRPSGLRKPQRTSLLVQAAPRRVSRAAAVSHAARCVGTHSWLVVRYAPRVALAGRGAKPLVTHLAPQVAAWASWPRTLAGSPPCASCPTARRPSQPATTAPPGLPGLLRASRSDSCPPRFWIRPQAPQQARSPPAHTPVFHNALLASSLCPQGVGPAHRHLSPCAAGPHGAHQCAPAVGRRQAGCHCGGGRHGTGVGHPSRPVPPRAHGERGQTVDFCFIQGENIVLSWVEQCHWQRLSWVQPGSRSKVVVLQGHKTWLSDVAISPSNDKIVTTSGEATRPAIEQACPCCALCGERRAPRSVERSCGAGRSTGLSNRQLRLLRRLRNWDPTRHASQPVRVALRLPHLFNQLRASLDASSCCWCRGRHSACIQP